MSRWCLLFVFCSSAWIRDSRCRLNGLEKARDLVAWVVAKQEMGSGEEGRGTYRW